MRKLANSAARDIASPAVKMGSKSLFPVVAVPLAFFCTLFFRHRKKSVSAPWDGKSLSAPESARHSPSKGISYGKVVAYCCKQGGFPLAPLHPLRGIGVSMVQGMRLRAHWGLLCSRLFVLFPQNNLNKIQILSTACLHGLPIPYGILVFLP